MLFKRSLQFYLLHNILSQLCEDSKKEESSTSKPTDLQSSPTKQKEENEEDDEDDDGNESSTGSSASITDFVPSAWNSQAVPNKSALRSPTKKNVSNQLLGS